MDEKTKILPGVKLSLSFVIGRYRMLEPRPEEAEKCANIYFIMYTPYTWPTHISALWRREGRQSFVTTRCRQ